MATAARKLAERVEREGRFGKDFSLEDNEDFLSDYPKTQAVVKGMSTAAKQLAGIPKALTARKGRSEEDMSELTREVAKGMKKGGSVSSASKRADGVAKRGKTRGKIY